MSYNTKQLPKVIGITELQRNAAKTLERLEKEGEIFVLSRDEIKAVLISTDEYEKLVEQLNEINDVHQIDQKISKTHQSRLRKLSDEEIMKL